MLYRRIPKYEVSAFGNVKLCLTDQDIVLENKDSERKNVGCPQYCSILGFNAVDAKLQVRPLNFCFSLHLP